MADPTCLQCMSYLRTPMAYSPFSPFLLQIDTFGKWLRCLDKCLLCKYYKTQISGQTQIIWVGWDLCLQVCLNFISSNKFFWRLLEIFNCKNESYTHFGVNVTAVILFVIASLNGNCGGIFESLSSPARKPCQPCKYYIRCSENITRIWNSKVQSITPTALQISLKPQV